MNTIRDLASEIIQIGFAIFLASIGLSSRIKVSV